MEAVLTTTRVTSKGQVTIPQHVREVLNIAPGDRIRFILHDGMAVLERELDVEDLYGAVKPKKKFDDIELMIREAKADYIASQLDG